MQLSMKIEEPPNEESDQDVNFERPWDSRAFMLSCPGLLLLDPGSSPHLNVPDIFLLFWTRLSPHIILLRSSHGGGGKRQGKGQNFLQSSCLKTAQVTVSIAGQSCKLFFFGKKNSLIFSAR